MLLLLYCGLLEQGFGLSRATEHYCTISKNTNSCPECGKLFAKAAYLKKHLRVTHKHSLRKPKTGGDTSKKPTVHICPKCGKTFYTTNNLRAHLKYTHKLVPRPPRKRNREKTKICPLCGKAFGMTGNLSQHLNVTHKRKPLKPVTCPKCDKVYTRRWALSTHMKRHHPESVAGPTEVLCEQCGRIFSDSAGLRQHIRFVHSKQWIAHCEHCGKGFPSAGRLNTHVREKHEKTFERVSCPIAGCESTLKNNTTLRYHQATVHGIRDASLHACATCGKSYANTRSYEKHVKMHEAGLVPDRAPAPPPPYVCNFCGRQVKTAQTLRDHIRTHTDERPFVCDVCSKGFHSKKLLKEHAVVHTGEKPYGCKVCDKRFSQCGSMSIHMKKKHPELPRGRRTYSKAPPNKVK